MSLHAVRPSAALWFAEMVSKSVQLAAIDAQRLALACLFWLLGIPSVLQAASKHETLIETLII